MNAPAIADEFEAEVIAAYGRHLRVRHQGEELRARPSGRRLSIVCGDRVRCEADRKHDEILIVEVLPRRTLLARANARGDSEPVVANVSQLVVGVAPVPRPDFFVIDRYLCAATAASIRGALAINKCDLGLEDDLPAEFAVYEAVGYPQVRSSAKQGEGLSELRKLLAGSVSVLVGQSGVGKSSLVRALLPEEVVVTGELVREEEGRHTTTSSRAYRLGAEASGGTLIDSPGVRDFAPAIDHFDERTLGFPEVELHAPACRFADCKHLQEPGCAVMAAVQTHEMAPRRYESYRRLRRLHTDLVEARGPGQRRRR